MLAQVAREALQLSRQIKPELQAAGWWNGELSFFARRRRSSALHRTLQALGQYGASIHPRMLFGQRVDQGFRNLQRAPYIAQRAARTVAGDHGGNRGALATIFGVDVLDDFFAPLVLKVHINIGRLVALARDKALKQHAHARRVHLGHAQAVAHRRIGRRSAPLAQDAAAARKAHDVVHREEIHLVLQFGD